MANANDSKNVSVGKGKVGGYLLSAPLGTSVPTDASTALDDAFVNLGYVSDDGITISRETETDDFKDLNGDTVLSVITSTKDSFNCNLMESKEEVFKEVYGQDNVTVTETTGTTEVTHKITVKTNSKDMPQRIYVMEFVLTGGKKMRKVIPLGKLTEWGDQEYQSGETIKYEITISAAPDTNGNTMYTYIEYNTPVSPTQGNKNAKKEGK